MNNASRRGVGRALRFAVSTTLLAFAPAACGSSGPTHTNEPPTEHTNEPPEETSNEPPEQPSSNEPAPQPEAPAPDPSAAPSGS